MRHAFRHALIASQLGLLLIEPADAQVYQCLDAGGKKVFSQMPCSTGGNGERLIMRAPAGATTATAPAAGVPVTGQPGAPYGSGSAAPVPKDWAAENAAANARAAAADASAGGSRQAMPSGLGGLRKSTPTPTSAGATDKQIIANCEANHGARCSSAGEIAQRRMEQRVLSPSEREQQQRAVADRRQREREESFNRMIRR